MPMVRKIMIAVAVSLLCGCSGSSPSTDAPSFDVHNAKSVSVDDLVLAFRRNEVAANDDWKGKSLVVTGYMVEAIDGDPPRLSVKGVSGNDIRAEVLDRAKVGELEVGETVELQCLGANSLAQITVADCQIAYHGKRRDKDPYWPDPIALKDPL
jgi:hypothetical protein